MAEQNKLTAKNYLNDLINEREFSSASQYITDRFLFNGKSYDFEKLKILASKLFLDSFEDMRVEIKLQITENDWVTSLLVFNGIHTKEYLGIPRTDKRVTFQGITVDRISNGKITEMWHEIDLHGLLMQIGAVYIMKNETG